MLRNWPMKHSPLRPQQPTYPYLLPSQPPMFFPNITTNVLRTELVKKLYLRIMSASKLMIVLLNTPACSNHDSLDGNLRGPPSATAFRSACVTTVTPTAPHTLAHHVLYVLPRRCSAHLRHLPPAASPTQNLPRIPFAAISASLTFCPLFRLPAFYNLLAGCWIWCHEGNLP